MIRFSIVLLVSIFLLNCGKSTDVSQFANPVEGKCPVLGEDVVASVTYTHEGKTYAFCCRECISKFKENPEKYLGNKSGNEHPQGDEHPNSKEHPHDNEHPNGSHDHDH